MRKSEMIESLIKKKIIIICGHYGAGKTNIAVNLAVKIKNDTGIVYTLVDLDTVNPYFRSADNTDVFRDNEIDFIIPPFANTNVDIPAVPPEIYSVFSVGRRAIIDVGGDDAGATVLGMFDGSIYNGEDNNRYEMIYVINKYRDIESGIDEVKSLADSIEKKAKLRITSVINNSNVGTMTTEKYIFSSFEYAAKVAEAIGVPLIGTSVLSEIADKISDDIKTKYKIFGIKDYTKKFF